MNEKLKIAYLRCEYKVNPLGIDVANPRLSWIIESSDLNEKGQGQTACQILVSSAEEKINNNIGDLWDSGKLISGQSNQIEYAGKKLKSGDKCWWKVRIWDINDNQTGWSETSCWTMGLLSKEDWKAKWIGFDKRIPESDNNKLSFIHGEGKWIWYPLERTEDKKGTGIYFFRRVFEIDKLNEIFSAEILITADESFVLYLNEKSIEQSDGFIFSWARPKKINIKSFLLPGKNIIAVKCTNFNLEKPGLALKLVLSMKDKKEIIVTDKKWISANRFENGWNNINFDDINWINACEIAEMGEKPWRIPHHELVLPPPVFLRKEFKIDKEIESAIVYVSSLGLYKLFINGQSISEDRLTPGWTDYNKRVYYNTYSVVKLMRTYGKNCIGIILADGWFSGYIGWEKGREYYGKNPKALLQLELRYKDGTSEYIFTDDSWKASYGLIQEADLLMGETYNSMKDKDFMGWSEPDFNDTEWRSVDVSDDLNIELNSYPSIPVREIMEVKAVKVTSPQNQIYIFDLGQNIAGVVRLKIDGRKTDKVVLRFGEMLDHDGSLYTENIRMARAADTYFTKGEEEEVWEPFFTYHGFRFVEVSGYPEMPETGMITGIVFSSDLPVTGSFKCSNQMLNQLYDNIVRSQRANFMDIPTDCPQRDERLGWTADAVDFIRTASFNMETASFYTKWLRDLNDAQEENGAYTAIAPQPDLGVGPLYAGSAGWADAGIIAPYTLYKFYGDKSILEKYFDNMIKYMDYLESYSDNFIRPDYGYGDWLSLDADTPKDLIATAFFAYDSYLMAEISGAIGKKTEEEKFRVLFERVKKAFNAKYVSKNGKIKSGTQTAYVLSLYFNLLDREKEQKAVKFLVDDIEKREYHVSAGFVGLTYIFPVLEKFKRNDIIFRILLNDSYPSWFYMIKFGATTLWERWNGWMPDKGFFDPLMNSFNHTSLGVIGEWLYSGIGGISLEEPGFRKFIIKPSVSGGLDNAAVSYFSIYGRIVSEWKIENGKFFLKTEIPVNTSARIYIPKISGKRNLRIPPGAEPSGEDEEFLYLNVGSGIYNFFQE